MDRRHLNDLLWFLAVAEERSFTRAAAKLGVSQSAISHTIRRLEGRLGVRLFNRTTRSVALTELGERLWQSLGPRMEQIDADIAALMDYRDRPQGRVRITLSDHAMRAYVWPKLRPVVEQYPDIQLELSVDNGFRNIVEDGFDAGIRLGESLEDDMIAVRVSPDWRLVVVATPEFWAQNPPPEHPRDLMRLDCINHRQETSGGLYAWEFSKGGEDLRVRVNGRLTFNISEPMIDAILCGFGVGFVPQDLVQTYITDGRLVQVLDDWTPTFSGYFVYYPSRQQTLPAFRVVIDALRYRASG